MSRNNTLRKDLQSDLRNQLNECRNRYKVLATMSKEIETEMCQCREHYISCFIQHQLLDHTLEGTASKTQTITSRFNKRFKYGDLLDGSQFETLFHKFNYGDVLHDYKFDMEGIVVHETKIYVTLWYYTDSENEFESKKRKKEDSKLQVMKRCTMVF